MVGPRGHFPWFLRAAVVFGLLGALWICTPNRASARPFPTEPGPGESGDPTADDLPSPTPKPKGKVNQISIAPGRSHDASLGYGRTVIVRVPWNVYLRLLARTWVR